MSTIAVTGNIVTDLELRQTNGGKPVVNFRVAEDRGYRKGDQWVEQPSNFYNVKVFGKPAEHLADSLAKGQEVMVQGEMTTETWRTEDQEPRSRQVIAARKVGAGLTYRAVNPQHPLRDREVPSAGGWSEDYQQGEDGWPVDDPQ